MTADQLRECREAFLREMGAMFGEISIMAFRQGHMPSGMGMAWTAWEKCWNTRPTAVASHAEGEVVAYSVPSGHAMPDGSMEDGPCTLVFADEASDYEKRIGFPLYTHPPRSGDEARDAENLKKFAHAIFQATDWPDGGDLDGFEFQEIAVKCGLLEEVEMKEPCGDVCHCYDMGADFPARCFRKTPLYYTCAAMAARGGS